jgi:hypothetical protein
VTRPFIRAAGIAALLAAACYSSFLLTPWTHAGRASAGGFISELETSGQPYAWLYRGSDIAAGIGILIAAWALHRVIAGHPRSRTGMALLAITGIGSILDGVTSMRCDPNVAAGCIGNEDTVHGLLGELLAVHTDTGLVGFLASVAGAILVGAATVDRWPVWGRVQIAVGIGIAGCGIADLILLLRGADVGAVERSRVLLTSGWLLILGLFLLSGPGTRRAPQPDVRAQRVRASRAWMTVGARFPGQREQPSPNSTSTCRSVRSRPTSRPR